MHTILLMGMPNAGELIITLLIIIAIPFFIFKAGQSYGESKKGKKK